MPCSVDHALIERALFILTRQIARVGARPPHRQPNVKSMRALSITQERTLKVTLRRADFTRCTFIGGHNGPPWVPMKALVGAASAAARQSFSLQSPRRS